MFKGMLSKAHQVPKGLSNVDDRWHRGILERNLRFGLSVATGEVKSFLDPSWSSLEA
jgi:hypothetical protein